MTRKLKIGADISGAKKSLKELSGILNSKEFQGKGAKIVDPKHIEFIKREGTKAVEAMNKKLKDQDRVLTKLSAVASDQNKSDKRREQAAKTYNRLIKQRLSLQKQLMDVEKAQNSINTATVTGGMGSRARGLGV